MTEDYISPFATFLHEYNKGCKQIKLEKFKMNKELIERIKELFEKELEKQTNWGRNQIKEVYTKVQNQALIEYIDKMEV